jgi:UDP-3-O-[3-hydroxymyristoyl] glucosamine N-acyltransferase
MPSYSLGELARAIDARLDGDPLVEVSGVAPLEGAGPEDLSFLANPKYMEAALASSAGALVVDEDYQANGQNVLRSDNPYLSFARAVDLLLPPPAAEPGVHQSATVDPATRLPDDISVGAGCIIGPDVVLGSGVVIGPQCVVEEGTEIGDGSQLFTRVTVHRGTRLGKGCIVQSGAVLGSDGFGYATDKLGQHYKVPQRGGLSIGDDVEIGANVTIDRGSAGETVIESGVKIDNLVHIAHNVQIGKNAIIVAQVGIAGSTEVGESAMLAGQVGIVGHVKIGARARVGAQGGVIGDIPADAEYSGYPARSHREQMRAHALFSRLPELFQRVKALERKVRSKS